MTHLTNNKLFIKATLKITNHILMTETSLPMRRTQKEFRRERWKYRANKIVDIIPLLQQSPLIYD